MEGVQKNSNVNVQHVAQSQKKINVSIAELNKLLISYIHLFSCLVVTILYYIEREGESEGEGEIVKKRE